MLKFIPFRKDGILLDPIRAAGEIVRELHNPDNPLRFCSFLESNESTMLLVAEETDAANRDDFGYVLSPLPLDTGEDIVCNVIQRYGAGYDTLAIFKIYGKNWGLFRCSAALWTKLEEKARRRAARAEAESKGDEK